VGILGNQTAAAQEDEAPSSEEKTGLNIGRRDWTRTKKPGKDGAS